MGRAKFTLKGPTVFPTSRKSRSKGDPVTRSRLLLGEIRVARQTTAAGSKQKVYAVTIDSAGFNLFLSPVKNRPVTLGQ